MQWLQAKFLLSYCIFLHTCVYSWMNEPICFMVLPEKPSRCADNSTRTVLVQVSYLRRQYVLFVGVIFFHFSSWGGLDAVTSFFLSRFYTIFYTFSWYKLAGTVASNGPINIYDRERPKKFAPKNAKTVSFSLSSSSNTSSSCIVHCWDHTQR